MRCCMFPTTARGPAFFAYADNYLVDVKSGIIMAAGMRRTPVKAEILIRPVEPDDDAQRRHRAAPFRPNYVA